MPRPFLIDPQAEPAAGLSYEDLAESIRGDSLPLPRRIKTGEFTHALRVLAQGLLCHADLTLYDGDLTPDECQRLGILEEHLAEQQVVRGLTEDEPLEARLASALAATGFQLTLCTSGSTGLPKRVRHRLPELTRSLRTSDRHRDNIWAFAYSPTHIAGVQVFLQAFANLNPLINIFRMPRAEVLAVLRRHRVTHLSATPTFYRMLLPVDDPLPEVRAVTLGGERTDAALIDRLRPLFPNARFRNLYASTEAGTLLLSEGDLFAIPPEAADRIRIVDAQIHLHRSLLGQFEGGTPDTAADWYPTGDLVEFPDPDSPRFRIIGRDHDWLNVGGLKVNPAEVEEILRSHPGIRDARVHGMKNSVVGTLVAADIVADDSLAETDLRRFLAERLQPHKVPRLFKRVPAIAAGRTGKLKRHDA